MSVRMLSVVIHFVEIGDTPYLYVVDPHHVAAVQGDGIATPHILRVQLSDVDVLQNDIGSTNNAKALSLNDTR